jgi:hypothetical protein
MGSLEGNQLRTAAGLSLSSRRQEWDSSKLEPTLGLDN